MDTHTALDTFFLIDHADTILVICDRIHRTCLFTGSFQMGNGIVRTGIGTHTALLTFVRINMGSLLSYGDSAKMAGILTSLAHTFPAVIRYHIRGDGTFLTGRIDDLYYIRSISF